jgi:hypothetical protein
MKKNWYLPIAVLAGGASLAVWTAATAAPPTAVTPGVKVVADVTPGSDTARDTFQLEDSPKPDDSPSLLSTPSPTASITAIPDHVAPQTQLVPAQPQTYAPVQTTDDKGGLRAPGVSDDGPTHDLNDDKGGLRAPGVSDDGPTHDLNDDKGGLRDKGVSDDGGNHDSGDDKGGDR